MNNHDNKTSDFENKTVVEDSNNNQSKSKLKRKRKRNKKETFKDILDVIMNENKSEKMIKVAEPIIPSKIDKI